MVIDSYHNRRLFGSVLPLGCEEGVRGLCESGPWRLFCRKDADVEEFRPDDAIRNATPCSLFLFA